MPMIIKNECPCNGCFYLTWSTTSYVYWCNKKQQSIVQHNGNGVHYTGQWLIPCGKDMRYYKEKNNND